jgi:hypothetical protein
VVDTEGRKNAGGQEGDEMTLSVALARPYFSPREIPREVDIVRNPRVKSAIMRGVEDSKAGRVKPWSEVKKEFGL